MNTKGIRFNRLPRVICMVGLGGTGGYILPALIRMIATSHHASAPPSIICYDPDIVELNNCNRQNFLPTDVGRYKAQCLAERYAAQFRIPVCFMNKKLEQSDLNGFSNSEILIIDAIDKLAPRIMISEFIKGYRYTDRGWISVGNTLTTGQAVFTYNSSLRTEDRVLVRFRDVIQLFPESFTKELLRQEQEIEAASCATNVVSQPQSLAINLTAANVVINMLYGLYFDSLTYDVVLFDSMNNCKTIPFNTPLISVDTVDLFAEFNKIAV